MKTLELQNVYDELTHAFRQFMGCLYEYRNGKNTPADVKKLHDAYNAKLKQFKKFAEDMQYLSDEEFDYFLKKV